MRVSRYLMAAAAATMAVAPAIAAPANPAASLSVAKAVRASAGMQGNSQLRGGNKGIFIALAAGIVIIVAIIIVGSEGTKKPKAPKSP